MKSSVSESKKSVSISSKAGKMISLIMGEIAVAIVIGIIFSLMMGSDIIAGVYTDGLSLLLVLGMTFVVLTATGFLQEFGRAFAYCVTDTSDTAIVQVKKATEAVKLSMVTAVLTGVLMAIIGVISLFYSPVLEETVYLPILLANNMIGMLYGIIVAILLLPIYARLKKQMIANE